MFFGGGFSIDSGYFDVVDIFEIGRPSSQSLHIHSQSRN
jgi:hypothetical protein